MVIVEERTRGRIVAALATVLLQGLVGYALIFGLSAKFPAKLADSLQVFEVAPAPPPPPEKVQPQRIKSHKPVARASPPNRKAKAAPIVVPPAVILPEVPPPVVAAVVAGIGTDADAGAAPQPGPGSGAGGQGNGTGSGDAGDGDGDGGDTAAQFIRGRITDRDYPRAAYEAGIGGTVYLRFVVGVDGRVTDCKVTRSSGNAELDDTTCRLLEQRSRYKPARDRLGRKVPDHWTGEHVWSVDGREDEPRDAGGSR